MLLPYDLVITMNRAKQTQPWSQRDDELGRCNFAEIHAVDVFGSSGGGDSTCHARAVEYHLVVKSHPQNEDAQRFLQPGHTFDKEVGMYGQVSQ